VELRVEIGEYRGVVRVPRWRHVISAPAPTGLDKASPLKRSDAMKETLAKEFPTPGQAYRGGSAP
jgi:hypothetical protein